MSSPYLSDIELAVSQGGSAMDAAVDAARAASDAATLEAYQDSLGDQLVLFGMVRELADVLDAPRPLVFAAVWDAPAEMQELLETPHGWAAWAIYVARVLGIQHDFFQPTVH